MAIAHKRICCCGCGCRRRRRRPRRPLLEAWPTPRPVRIPLPLLFLPRSEAERHRHGRLAPVLLRGVPPADRQHRVVRRPPPPAVFCCWKYHPARFKLARESIFRLMRCSFAQDVPEQPRLQRDGIRAAGGRPSGALPTLPTANGSLRTLLEQSTADSHLLVSKVPCT